MRDAEVISAAKQGFEAAFAEQQFYDKQTQDAAHLQTILDFLPVRNGMRILDIGTGTGYLAFALAELVPAGSVTGLDITEHALQENRKRADREGRRNLQFVCYDGAVFPFPDGCFDLAVSRYSFHHFPDIRRSLSEVRRVLTADGLFFVSDPAPNEADTAGFADAFMRVKPDGHIRFYTGAEWSALCGEQGLVPVNAFRSEIRFPRRTEPAYLDLLEKYDKTITTGHHIELIGSEIYITEQVNNCLFCKTQTEV